MVIFVSQGKNVIISWKHADVSFGTKLFNDYYPCMKAGLYKLHIHKRITLFVFMHNSIVKSSSTFNKMKRWVRLTYIGKY